MLKIFICGFDKSYSKKLFKVMLKNKNLRFEVRVIFIDELKKILVSGESLALYFLPIEIRGVENGVNLGLLIRSYSPNSKIVYITAYIELITYIINNKIEVLDILFKKEPIVLKTDLFECMSIADKRIVTENEKTTERMSFKTRSETILTSMDDIYYFETAEKPHQITIHTRHGSYDFYGKMKELVKRHKLFFRCHKSYIINLSNIKKIDQKNRCIYFDQTKKCYYAEKQFKNMMQKIPKKIN